MSKERLSKLQKWILMRALKNYQSSGKFDDVDELNEKEKRRMQKYLAGLKRYTIHHDFWGHEAKIWFAKNGHWRVENYVSSVHSAVLSRSLKRLEERGLIEIEKSRSAPAQIQITYHGSKVALKLRTAELSVKNRRGKDIKTK